MIIIQQIGKPRASLCELRVTLQQTPYRLYNPAVNASSGGGFRSLAQAPPNIPAIAPDPDFPLRIQIQVLRGMYSSMNGNHTEGRGNVLGSPNIGFDFYDSCDQRLPMGFNSNQYFQARWKKQDTTLEILLQEVGSNKISRCDIELTIQPQPYDLSRGPRPPSARPLHQPLRHRPASPRPNSAARSNAVVIYCGSSFVLSRSGCNLQPGMR